LNEYGRRSFVEIVDEISVRHGKMIARTLRDTINKNSFNSFDLFDSAVLSKFRGIDRDQLLSDLFQYGVIGNFDSNYPKTRFYWAHRGEEYFK